VVIKNYFLETKNQQFCYLNAYKRLIFLWNWRIIWKIKSKFGGGKMENQKNVKNVIVDLQEYLM